VAAPAAVIAAFARLRRGIGRGGAEQRDSRAAADAEQPEPPHASRLVMIPST